MPEISTTVLSGNPIADDCSRGSTSAQKNVWWTRPIFLFFSCLYAVFMLLCMGRAMLSEFNNDDVVGGSWKEKIPCCSAASSAAN